MGRQIKHLQQQVKRTLQRNRAIFRLLHTPVLIELWEKSDEETKKKLASYVNNEDKLMVRTWLKEHPFLELGDMPLEILKVKAQKLGVINYSRICKEELIMALESIDG